MKAKPLDFTGFLRIIQLTKNNNFMKKTDFDTCHRPSFLILGFFDALYTPIWVALMHVYCVIHMHDAKDEVYSFAVKRLNQQDDTQIVVEESLVTEKYPMNLPDEGRNRLLAYMDFLTIKNKLDKVALYKEWYSKAYILANDKACEQTQLILDGNFWYDSDRTARVVGKYVELVNARASLKKAATNADRMKVNKLIKTAIADLNSEEF